MTCRWRPQAALALGFAVVTLGVAGPVWAQAPPVLTLAQAVGEALVRNDRLVNQREAVTYADLRLDLARSAFRPKVTPNVFGSFGQSNVSSQTYRLDVSERLITGTEVRASIGTVSAQIPGVAGGSDEDVAFYNADTTLSLSQPLLRGFGRDVARRPLASAEYQRAGAERFRALSEQQVAIDVAAAYYRVVAQQSLVDAARQSLARSMRLREAAEAKLAAGLVSQLDVLRAGQLVAQAESALFDAQSMTEDARDQLTWLVGRPYGDRFDVDTRVPPPDLSAVDIERAVTVARAHRIDLLARVAEQEEAERHLRFARNQLLPQFDLNLALTRRQTSPTFRGSFGMDGFRAATFFNIAVPVDRTSQRVDFQTALMGRDRATREIENVERQVADEVRRVIRERQRLARALDAAITNVDLATREAEVAQFRYERGLSNNLDVVSAEGAVLAAEGRRIEALAALALSRLRIRAVVGIFDPRADIDRAVGLLDAAGARP